MAATPISRGAVLPKGEDVNSSFNLTVNRRLGVFIGSECALFESERAQAGHTQARRLFEQARAEALSELAQSRRSLEMAIRGRVEGTDALRLRSGQILSERSESWFDFAHHDPERGNRVEGSKDAPRLPLGAIPSDRRE